MTTDVHTSTSTSTSSGRDRTRTLRIIALWVTTAFHASPGLTIVMCLTTVLSAALAPFSAYGVKLAVDGVTQGTSIWPGIAIVGAALLCNALSSAVSGPMGDTLGERVHLHVHDDLIRLTAQLPGIAHHEHPALADRIALIERDSYSLVGVWRMFSLVGAATGTFALVVMLSTVSPWLNVLLLLGLGVTATQATGHIRREALWRDNEKYRRLGEKVVDVLATPSSGVEARAFGLHQPLLGVAAEAHEIRHRAWHALTLRFGALGVLGWIVYGLGYAAAVVWVVVGASRGETTIGDVTMLVVIGPQINTTARSITSSYAVLVESMSVFARYEWLREHARTNDWSDSSQRPPDRLTDGIRFSHVDFAYPSSVAAVAGDSEAVSRPATRAPRTARASTKASASTRASTSTNASGDADGAAAGAGPTTPRRSLTDVDLHLPAGSTVAFVGDNGAGKSTLVKLLARLYDPTGGTITVDGVPLAEIDPVAWRERVSAGFQDFAALEFLAAETVAVGDLTGREDQELIESAVDAGQARAVVAGLSQGLDTQLGQQFTGGVGLSGGQWQRLALSRAFMRRRPLLMLLDEPTAALDPEAESSIYTQYGETARRLAKETGAVTVLVSHRFSTVRMADLIVVVADGRIAEVGTHAELLAAGGRYAELFDLQASAYR